jgi:hypothetical protein
MMSNRRASRCTRSGVSAAYLVARQRTYSGTLGRAARRPGVLVIVCFGLRRGNKRKANGSTDQPKSHSSLHLFEPSPTETPDHGCFTSASGKEAQRSNGLGRVGIN